jgi:trans-aconitate 2-methyltransferase
MLTRLENGESRASGETIDKKPHLDPLDEIEREAFLARHEAAIAEAYPAEAEGTMLLPFPRLFFVAGR